MGTQLSCIKEFKQLCHDKLKLCTLTVEPTKCYIVADKELAVKVGEEFKVSLVTNLGNGKPTQQQSSVTFRLVSLVDGLSVDGPCQKDRRVYTVKYTPTTRGQHKLYAYVNREEVPGSPVSVFASLHPLHLSKPILTITDLRDPFEVAVSSSGKVIVRES